jgi:hypothetical protein
MTTDTLRWLAGVHGVLAWAATLGLTAAAIAQRQWGQGTAKGRAIVAAAAAVLVSGAFGVGLRLDLPYRGRLRQQVFIDAPALGWLFERKLHLSFGAVALAWCAVALLAASAAAAQHRGRSAALGRGGRATLAASAGLAILAAIASAIVGRRHSF